LRYSKETGRLKETDSISLVAREQAMYAR